MLLYDDDPRFRMNGDGGQQFHGKQQQHSNSSDESTTSSSGTVSTKNNGSSSSNSNYHPKHSNVPVPPSPSDVLVGARGSHPSGPGNDRFNRIIDSYISKYDMAKTKNDKGRLFVEIYQTVKCFGRFLCNDAKTASFYEISEHHAKEKISHALRYRRKKQMAKRLKKNLTAAVATGDTVSTVNTLGELWAAERKARGLAVVPPVLSSPIQLREQKERPPPPQQQQRLASLSLVSLSHHHHLELFSDEELALVLGQPREIDWTTLPP